MFDISFLRFYDKFKNEFLSEELMKELGLSAKVIFFALLHPGASSFISRENTGKYTEGKSGFLKDTFTTF